MTSNTNGQIVIPQKIREKLGIKQNTLLKLTLTGTSLILHPIVAVLTKSDSQQNYLEILIKTAGAWKQEKRAIDPG